MSNPLLVEQPGACTADAPEPLTRASSELVPLPKDVNISDMPHLPWYDARLTKSRTWLSARNWRGNGPGLGFALVNLWMAAFRNVPAGCLEDDDEMLAEAAKVSIEHWILMKEKALRGWQRYGGQLWHRVVAELAWDLWLKRLTARHQNAVNSWRMSAKRATEKGREPKDPPDEFLDWMAEKYPASFAHMVTLDQSVTTACSANNAQYSANIEPKRSEAKDTPPLSPHQRVLNTPSNSLEDAKRTERKRWYAQELSRLKKEFQPIFPVMLSSLQRPGVSGHYGLVQYFKGCSLVSGAGSRIVVITPSKRRADLILEKHGDWLSQLLPNVEVRSKSRC